MGPLRSILGKKESSFRSFDAMTFEGKRVVVALLWYSAHRATRSLRVETASDRCACVAALLAGGSKSVYASGEHAWGVGTVQAPFRLARSQPAQVSAVAGVDST